MITSHQGHVGILSGHPKVKHSSIMMIETGFSMIEVLISIIVLTIGLLGMVGIQAASLRANREARLQSSAMVLARELADMLRGNKQVGIRTTANPYLFELTSPLQAVTPSFCLNVASGRCADNTEVANAQITEWLARLDAELPGARVVSCIDAAPFDEVGLPQWSCTAPVAGVVGSVVIKIGWTRGATDRSATGTAALDLAANAGSLPGIVLPVTAGI